MLSALRTRRLPPWPQRQRPRRTVLSVEALERRNLLTTFAPAQLVHAYGFDQVSFGGGAIRADGAGQTIAIVDAYDDPNIAADLQTFDAKYGLANPVFIKATPGGLPAANSSWATEIALDVEWAHAIAPAATILLVEAVTANDSDLLAAVDYAASQPGVSAVSMSWGTSEFSTETSAAYDGHFTGHTGVTFVAASGDSGSPPGWPAVSPNVVAVGGTSLTLTSTNAWNSEKGWGYGSWSVFFGGSGGGISKYEPKPSYQSAVTQSSTKRTNPDVAYDADPGTGVSVYDSVNGGWTTVGGTSAGSPQWAALLAITNQGRLLAGKTALSSPQTLSGIYGLAATDFHDITSGNNGYAASTGYDLVTGRGTPKANLVINDLINKVAGAAAVSAAVAPAGGSTSSANHAVPVPAHAVAGTGSFNASQVFLIASQDLIRVAAAAQADVHPVLAAPQSMPTIAVVSPGGQEISARFASPRAVATPLGGPETRLESGFGTAPLDDGQEGLAVPPVAIPDTDDLADPATAPASNVPTDLPLWVPGGLGTQADITLAPWLAPQPGDGLLPTDSLVDAAPAEEPAVAAVALALVLAGAWGVRCDPERGEVPPLRPVAR